MIVDKLKNKNFISFFDCLFNTTIYNNNNKYKIVI
jgi:hypothetical protein